jgi:hypothetical protein
MKECACVKFISGHVGSCHLLPKWKILMPPLETAPPSHPLSPHPATTADEGMEVDGLRGLNFHLALFIGFLIFLSSELFSTLSVATLLFLSFYLLLLFLCFK